MKKLECELCGAKLEKKIYTVGAYITSREINSIIYRCPNRHLGGVHSVRAVSV